MVRKKKESAQENEMDGERDQSHLEQQIDDNLRKVFQRTMDEQVPDRLTSLLQQLKEQDTRNDQ
ncbi:NepR family anti-sigma factor [Psychromarinibacter sp. C21-152]|uniref:NepR family anti-sigma factor n=2 Tax=Psychromarinibacter sediminicola TaxID=3033385 RepID=A0AAE3T7Y9_9RHOB|nr:NepR family anti-sigma factor [Psychromarinibacter sediminicola]